MARKPAASVGKSVRNTSTPPDTVVPSRMEWARSQKLGQCLTQQAEPRVPSRQQWKQRALLRRYTCVVQNKVSTNFGGTLEAKPNESVGARSHRAHLPTLSGRIPRDTIQCAPNKLQTRSFARQLLQASSASRPGQDSARRDRAVSLQPHRQLDIEERPGPKSILKRRPFSEPQRFDLNVHERHQHVWQGRDDSSRSRYVQSKRSCDARRFRGHE